MLNKFTVRKAKKLWLDFVTKNHHKERDLQFFIVETDTFYKKEKKYCAVMPSSYIIGKLVCSDWRTSKDAAIIDLILTCFHEMRPWCNEVIEHPEEYDVEQRNQAKFYSRSEKERLSLAGDLQLSHTFDEYCRPGDIINYLDLRD